MELGVGLDARLGLTAAQLRDLAPAARDLGYHSVWTNAGTEYDPVVLCAAWHERSGLATGIAVAPLQRNPPAVLALASRTAHELADGAFTLGIGSGSITDRPIEAVRDYVAELQRSAPRVPLLIGALGPRMLRLAGSTAAGAALNWCTPEHVSWSRARVGAGRTLAAYVRVCVDDDVDAARRVLARQIIAYALPAGSSPSRGYPAHFRRMGFGDELAFLGSRRAAGVDDAGLAAAMPERLVRTFGYAGRGDGAREWLARMARGLDVVIVRVLSARPGEVRAVRAAMEAFAPR